MEPTRMAREDARSMVRQGRLPAARGITPTALAALVALAACGQVRGEVPDTKAFSFPTSVVVDPAGDTVYVVSTNFDSRWQFGWVTPIDAAGPTILDQAAVETGSFAGEPAFESLNGTASRMILPIRDDDKLTLIDVTRDTDGKPVLSCGAALPDGRRRCGDESSTKLEGLARDPDDNVVAANDPFAITLGQPVVIVGDQGTPDTLERPLYVASLLEGTLLIFALREGSAPVYQGYQQLESGVHTLIEFPVSDDERVLLAGTRSRNIIYVLRVLRKDGVWTAMTEDPVAIPQSSATGDYLRGMTMSPRGPVLYAAYRSPPSLAVFDIPADGRPILRNFVALAGLPSGVAVYAPAGSPDIVYVTDFEGDSLYAVDPVVPEVLARVSVGQGPYGIAIAADRAFIADFEDQEVSVVALGLGDPDRHKEIKRLP